MRPIDDPNRYDPTNNRVYLVNVETGKYTLKLDTNDLDYANEYMRTNGSNYSYPVTLMITNDRDVEDSVKIEQFCQFIMTGKGIV